MLTEGNRVIGGNEEVVVGAGSLFRASARIGIPLGNVDASMCAPSDSTPGSRVPTDNASVVKGAKMVRAAPAATETGRSSCRCVPSRMAVTVVPSGIPTSLEHRNKRIECREKYREKDHVDDDVNLKCWAVLPSPETKSPT